MERDHDLGAMGSPQTQTHAGTVLPATATGGSNVTATRPDKEQQEKQQQGSHVKPSERDEAVQLASLCSLPDLVVQQVLRMLGQDSRDQTMAACKQLGRLMLTAYDNVIYRLDVRRRDATGTALGKPVQWALECCKQLHLYMNTPLRSTFAPLTLAWPDGCLPSVTKLTLMFTKLDGLLPDHMVQAMPSLKSVDYYYCRFETELQPVSTSPAVKLQHLGVNVRKEWNAKEWSAAQMQQLQELTQLRSLTSLGLPLHNPIAACLGPLASQLTAITLYVDNDYQDASAWPVLGNSASLQQFAAKFAAGWKYKIAAPIEQVLKDPGLSSVEISGIPISSTEMLQLLSIPHLTSLLVHSISGDLPGTWPNSKLQQLCMQRATLQQLAGAPLQQLTSPLKQQELVVTEHSLQEQRQWAATAAQGLRAGPGHCIGWVASPYEHSPRFEVTCETELQTAADMAQVLEACGPLLLLEHHVPVYILSGMDLCAPVMHALKRFVSVQSYGIGGFQRLSLLFCKLQPGAGAAIAAAFPDLKLLVFNTLPELSEIKDYIRTQQQQRLLVPDQELYLRADGHCTYKVYKEYLKQLKDYLSDSGIDWFKIKGVDVGVFICGSDDSEDGEGADEGADEGEGENDHNSSDDSN